MGRERREIFAKGSEPDMKECLWSKTVDPISGLAILSEPRTLQS